jgi:hypothetical protein
MLFLHKRLVVGFKSYNFIAEKAFTLIDNAKHTAS